MAPQAGSGASAMDQFRQYFYQAPPISRTLAAAIVLISWSAMILHVLPLGWLYFDPRLVFQLKSQFWRLVTPFFVSGSGLNLVLDPYFFFHYSSLMERDSPRFALPGDMAVFFAFVGLASMAISHYIAGSVFFLSHLTMALVYMYSQDDPEQMTTFIVIKVRRKFLPYCTLLVTLLMGGPFSMLNEVCGLVAAHAYNFLTKTWPEHGGSGRNPLPTPLVVRRWFAAQQAGGRMAGATTRPYGTAFESRNASSVGGGAGGPAAGGGGAGSWTSGLSSALGGGTWGSRGQGRRLGGD